MSKPTVSEPTRQEIIHQLANLPNKYWWRLLADWDSAVWRRVFQDGDEQFVYEVGALRTKMAAARMKANGKAP